MGLTAGHIIYIPVILAIGLIAGWFIRDISANRPDRKIVSDMNTDNEESAQKARSRERQARMFEKRE